MLPGRVRKSLQSSADSWCRRSSRLHSLSPGNQSLIVAKESCIDVVLSSSTSCASAVMNTTSTTQCHTVSGRKRSRRSTVEQNHGKTVSRSSSRAKSNIVQQSGSLEQADGQLKVTSGDESQHMGHDRDLELYDTDFKGHDVIAKRTRRSSMLDRHVRHSSGSASCDQEKPKDDNLNYKHHLVKNAVLAKRARLSRRHAAYRRSHQRDADTDLSTDTCTVSTSDEPMTQRPVLVGTSVRLPGRVGKRKSAVQQSVS